MSKLRRWAGLVLVFSCLLALRGSVYLSAANASSGGDRTPLLQAEQVGHRILFFALSLSFEFVVVIVLAAVAQIGRPFRWVARGLLAVLLWANCMGTVGYFKLRTYVRGFQLDQTNPNEVFHIGRSLAHPAVLATVLALLGIALLFAREGALEHRLFRGWGRAVVGCVGLVSLVGFGLLVTRRSDFPTLAYSPVTLLLDRAPPVEAMKLPRGAPDEADFAKVRTLEPRWSQLGSVDRHFNIVLLVLESTRAASFWPSPGAPPLPHVAALAPHAVFFNRAYAHEPLSLKAFESLVFGVYPNPEWEVDIRPRRLNTLADHWRRHGMRTAMIDDCLPLPDASLRDWGFTDLLRGAQIEKIDPTAADPSLATALDQFIDRAGGDRFAAVIWTRDTHYPYEPPTAKVKAPTPWEAYRRAIAKSDEVVARVEEVLERRHLADNTVLAILGDHGEAFAEHPESGYVHGAWVFEESTHVPMMLVNPRLFHGEREEDLVQQKDLSATLAWLAGDDDPNLNDGRALFFSRPSRAAYLANSWDGASVRGGVISGKLKYMIAESVGDVAPDERLFDLDADPGERHNLWLTRHTEGLALRDRFFGWYNAQRAADRVTPGEASNPAPGPGEAPSRLAAERGAGSAR